MKMFFKVMALVGFMLVSAEVAAWGNIKNDAESNMRTAVNKVRDQFNGKAKERAAAKQKVAAAQARLMAAQAELAAAEAELKKLS